MPMKGWDTCMNDFDHYYFPSVSEQIKVFIFVVIYYFWCEDIIDTSINAKNTSITHSNSLFHKTSAFSFLSFHWGGNIYKSIYYYTPAEPRLKSCLGKFIWGNMKSRHKFMNPPGDQTQSFWPCSCSCCLFNLSKILTAICYCFPPSFAYILF